MEPLALVQEIQALLRFTDTQVESGVDPTHLLASQAASILSKVRRLRLLIPTEASDLTEVFRGGGWGAETQTQFAVAASARLQCGDAREEARRGQWLYFEHTLTQTEWDTILNTDTPLDTVVRIGVNRLRLLNCSSPSEPCIARITTVLLLARSPGQTPAINELHDLSEEVKKKIKMFVKPFVHPCGWIKTYPRNVAEFPTDILAFAYNTDSVAVPCPLHVPDITYISGLKFMRSSAAELRAAESRHKHTGKPPTLQLNSDSSSSNSLEQMLGRAFQGMAMMQQHNHSQLAQLLGGQGERASWTPAPTLPSLNDAPCPLGSLNTVQGESTTSLSVYNALQQGKMFTPRTKAPLAAIMGLGAQASTSDAFVIPKQPQGPPPKQPQFGFSLPGHALIADAVQPPPDVMDADDVIDGMAEKIPETPNATDTELDPLQELLQATSAAMHSSNKPAKQPPTGPDAKPKTTRQKIAAMAKVPPPSRPRPLSPPTPPQLSRQPSHHHHRNE
jgi:hypothetical protein